MYFKIKISKRFNALLLSAIIFFSCFIFVSGNDESIYAVKIENEEIAVPIIMYHSILKDKSRQGKFVISPDDLESDLLYLKNNGYTTVTINDLIEYTEGKCDLPEKPIIMSFDDGYYNNYCYAYPLFKKYNSKFVLAVIGTYTDQYSKNSDDLNPYYAHCTWKNLLEMSNNDVIEIQNHSFNLHLNNGTRLGTKQRKSESNEKYKTILFEDISKNQELIKLNTNIECSAFVYPFGAYNEYEESLIKEFGFKASLSCAEKLNIVTKNKDCLYSLGRYLRSSDRSLKKILNLIYRE